MRIWPAQLLAVVIDRQVSASSHPDDSGTNSRTQEEGDAFKNSLKSWYQDPIVMTCVNFVKYKFYEMLCRFNTYLAAIVFHFYILY